MVRFPSLSWDFEGALVDIDNTLYEYDVCHESGLQSAYKAILNWKKMDYDQFESTYKEARAFIKERVGNTAASHHRSLYFQNVLECILGHTAVEATLDVVDSYWEGYLKNMALSSEAEQFLEICREKKIKICLVTDFTLDLQFKKIQRLGIESLFQFMVTSEEAGVEKPDKRIFELALNKLGLPPNEVIMIGDNLKRDSGSEQIGVPFFPVTIEKENV